MFPTLSVPNVNQLIQEKNSPRVSTSLWVSHDKSNHKCPHISEQYDQHSISLYNDDAFVSFGFIARIRRNIQNKINCNNKMIMLLYQHSISFHDDDAFVSLSEIRHNIQNNINFNKNIIPNDYCWFCRVWVVRPFLKFVIVCGCIALHKA